jgi:hypothetical protein
MPLTLTIGEFTVTYGRSKRPVAVLAPPPAAPKRKLGLFRGKLRAKIGPDWELDDEAFLRS